MRRLRPKKRGRHGLWGGVANGTNGDRRIIGILIALCVSVMGSGKERQPGGRLRPNDRGDKVVVVQDEARAPALRG